MSRAAQLSQDLKSWARTLRSVRCPETAELIDRIAEAVETEHTNAELALEAAACALFYHNERRVSTLVRDLDEASELLRPSKTRAATSPESA